MGFVTWFSNLLKTAIKLTFLCNFLLDKKTIIANYWRITFFWWFIADNARRRKYFDSL